jgi:hypothetical protein
VRQPQVLRCAAPTALNGFFAHGTQDFVLGYCQSSLTGLAE